jgi:hypothetical protein
MYPQKNAIAYCMRGILGVITTEVPDKDGVWYGFRLTPTSKAGFPWQSKRPRVIAYVKNNNVLLAPQKTTKAERPKENSK